MLRSQIIRLTKIEADLNATFLNFGKRASGNYTKQEMTNGAAYLILSHAAVEEFFESIASGVASRSEKKFKSTGKINRVIAFLVFANSSASKNLPDQVPTKDIHEEFVLAALGNYKKIIDKNHGIKEHNLCRLFLPLGYSFDKVDPLLFPELNALGSARGDLAHKSLTNKVFDPFAGKAQLTRVLSLLTTFETSLSNFISAHA